MKTSNDNGKLIGFSLLAGIVGAGIGVLFAPHKGSKTRKRLTKEAKNIAEDIQDRIKDETNAICSKVQELEDDTMFSIEGIIKDVKHKANDLVHR